MSRQNNTYRAIYAAASGCRILSRSPTFPIFLTFLTFLTSATVQLYAHLRWRRNQRTHPKLRAPTTSPMPGSVAMPGERRRIGGSVITVSGVAYPTIADAAMELQVSTRTVRDYIAKGLIPDPPTVVYGLRTIAVFPADYIEAAKTNLNSHRSQRRQPWNENKED